MRGILTGPNAGWIQSSALGAKMNDSEMLIVPKTPCECEQPGMVAEAEITQIWAANEVSLGDFDCGYYFLRYCGGAWNFGTGDPTNKWVATRAPTGFPSPPGSEGQFIVVKYDDGDSTANLNEPIPPVSGQGYASETAAEAAACGSYTSFWHTGGEISLVFEEYFYPDNTLGTRGPTFRLYASTSTPVLTFVDCSGEVLGANSYRGTFNFTESTGFTGPIKFTLDSGDGIASPSGPTTVDVTAGTPFSVQFTWSGTPSGQNVVTANITASTVCDGELDSWECDLAPVIATAELSHSNSGDPDECGFDVWWENLRVTNNGNQATQDLHGVVTAVSGARLTNPLISCEIVSSYTLAIPHILAKDGGTFDASFTFTPNDGATEAVFDIAYTDGPVTHPTARITVDLT